MEILKEKIESFINKKWLLKTDHQKYVFEFHINNICKKLKEENLIFDYNIVMDETNNTSNVKELGLNVLDIYYQKSIDSEVNVLNYTIENTLIDLDDIDIQYFDEKSEHSRFKWGIFTKKDIYNFSEGCILIVQFRDNDEVSFYSEFDDIWIDMCKKFNINTDNIVVADNC